jgi:Domain of unknown function (DUF4062)
LSNKRYQVFVSSTSADLEEERRAVIDALLEASYIPVGMELFNAATEAAWPTIERIINSCDYYILIVAARYGHVLSTGMSFTESEYDYARSLNKPILAFLHVDPESLPKSKTERNEERAAKVEQFRERLKNDLLCKFWRGTDELARKVVGGLNAATVSNPQPGWVRSDPSAAIPDERRVAIAEPAALIGISRISVDGQAGAAMSDNIAKARTIRIMATSTARIIEIQKPYLVEALGFGCQIRVLVPVLDGTFLTDVEESESQDEPREPISDEIRTVERRLREAVAEAYRASDGSAGNGILGSARMGHFTTHLRSTMVLCDETWGWLTITLPPARAPETPSLELLNSGRYPLLRACLRHFDRTWDIVDQRGSVRMIEARSRG